jgi:hypothetical protein
VGRGCGSYRRDSTCHDPKNKENLASWHLRKNAQKNVDSDMSESLSCQVGELGTEGATAGQESRERISGLYLHNRYVQGTFEFMSRILNEIRKAIEASDKTRYRLSQETSIPQSQLSRFMTGEKGLSFDAMERLAEALGVEIIIRPRKVRRKKGL